MLSPGRTVCTVGWPETLGVVSYSANGVNRATSGPVALQLAAGEHHPVHLVRTVGEPQRRGPGPEHRPAGSPGSCPPAPWTWIALSITHCAVAGAATLIAEISVAAPFAPTVSISQARLQHQQPQLLDAGSGTRRSSLRTTPCSASGRPNATRSSTRRHIRSNARSAIADQAHAVVDAARAQPGLGDREAAALARRAGCSGRHAHVVERHLGVPAVRRRRRSRTTARPRRIVHARGVARHQHHRLPPVPLARPARSPP